MIYDTLTLKGTRYVLVPEPEFKAMSKAVPGVPSVDQQGNMPALAFADASIARAIVRRREAAGLSQKELAESSGIRVEILNRAERGVTIPAVATLTKIEAALAKATTGRKKTTSAGPRAADRRRSRP